MNVKERVLKCIEENGITLLEDGSFGHVDSIDFISTIVEIEMEFDLEFPDEYFEMGVLKNVKSIILYIEDICHNKSSHI